MTGVLPHKTAWSDPDHVRLASFRSPDDGTKIALRGPVPPFLDPWLTGGGELPAALSDGGSVRLSRGDDYAAFRCGCKHLVYQTDEPGGSCRFCPCTDHRAATRGTA